MEQSIPHDFNPSIKAELLRKLKDLGFRKVEHDGQLFTTLNVAPQWWGGEACG